MSWLASDLPAVWRSSSSQVPPPEVGLYCLNVPASEMIEVTFDFRSDTPPGRDPDTFSPTLRTYHQLLWSNPLPSGAPSTLDATPPPCYFRHASELGEFLLSSDAVVATFSRARELADIFPQFPREETGAFNRLGYTIGGMMVFPANTVGRKTTINGARGCHPRIRDRFDLTVECIRRHYVDKSSPLSEALARYSDFFRLFGDFAGYVDFLLPGPGRSPGRAARRRGKAPNLPAPLQQERSQCAHSPLPDVPQQTAYNPTCDTLAGPDGVQVVDLGIYASWWTNLRTNKSWQMISG